MSCPEIESFVKNWNRIHKQTSLALRAAPADRMEWRPKEGMFSLRELVTHIPQAELMITRSAIAGSKQKVELDLSNLPPEEIADIFDRQHAELAEEVSKLGSEQIRDKVEIFGKSLPRIVLLHGMVEHEIHHRGQLYAFLRLVDVEPPPLF
ncbi:MAG TPA: DinB family protein [Blastocatellia bacterium]|nr:DinB family protein [Blastocatellia bacterium]